MRGISLQIRAEMATHELYCLLAIRDRVRSRPHVARYLASDRRLPFNEDGAFRRYPELDALS